MQEFIYLKNLKKSSPRDYEINFVNLFKNYENQYLQILEAQRQNIISGMGAIKADSKQGQRAKKYLKSFMTNYYKKDGTLHAGMYNMNVAEREAITLGFVFEERLKTMNKEFCFLDFAQKFKPKYGDDKQMQESVQKELNETYDEINHKMSFKEYLKYLYE